MSAKKTKASTKKVQKNVKVKAKNNKPKIVKKVVKKIEKKPAAKTLKKAAPKAKIAVKTKAKKPAAKIVKKPAKIIKAVAKKPAKKVVVKTAKKEKVVAKVVKSSTKVSKKAEKLPAKVEKKPVEVVAAKPAVKAGKAFNFKVGEYAVYPSHGIGKIIDIDNTTVLGEDFSCYLMLFEKEKLTIKVPVKNSEKIGLRPLVSKAQMEEVFTILRSGIKKLKGMWSRRAQEYESKINSGNIILLAEVLRDLTRDIEDGERSYSERIIYETAVSRLASEYSAIYKIDFEEAKGKVVITAKDKLGSDDKSAQDDDFDYVAKIKGDDDIDEEEVEEEEEDEDAEDEDDSYDDDDDDDKPRKKRKK